MSKIQPPPFPILFPYNTSGRVLDLLVDEYQTSDKKSLKFNGFKVNIMLSVKEDLEKGKKKDILSLCFLTK